MNSRKLSIVAGIGYLIIFFAAIFANFFVLESIIQSPVDTIQNHSLLVGFGILAFLITVVFDVIVAWALFELYRENFLSRLSTYFRLMHALIMAVAVFALPLALKAETEHDILFQVDTFNIIWLTGLFFFGIHLILLGKIIGRPKIIVFFLTIAGVMYMMDTCAHFMLAEYKNYADLFLALVAIPSIVGEMSFAIWLLVKAGK